MNNVVISGGAGFIGSHVVDAFLTDTSFNVIVLDNFSYCASSKNIDPQVKQIEKR